MDFSTESSRDCDGNPLTLFWVAEGEEPVGIVSRTGATWRCNYYPAPGHVSGHLTRHQAEMAMCEILLGA